MTPGSMLSPWLTFEAGAISNAELAKVCPLLFQLDAGKLQGPLAQFQATPYSEGEVRQLVTTINGLVPAPLTDAQLTRNFDRLWPELDQAISVALAEPEEGAPERRSPNDMLEELLATVRTLSNTVPQQATEGQLSEDTVNHWMVSFRSVLDFGLQIEAIAMSPSKDRFLDALAATINHLRLMLNLIQPKIVKSRKFKQFEKEAKTLMGQLEGSRELFDSF